MNLITIFLIMINLKKVFIPEDYTKICKPVNESINHDHHLVVQGTIDL